MSTTKIHLVFSPAPPLFFLGFLLVLLQVRIQHFTISRSGRNKNVSCFHMIKGKENTIRLPLSMPSKWLWIVRAHAPTSNKHSILFSCSLLWHNGRVIRFPCACPGAAHVSYPFSCKNSDAKTFSLLFALQMLSCAWNTFSPFNWCRYSVVVIVF